MRQARRVGRFEAKDAFPHRPAGPDPEVTMLSIYVFSLVLGGSFLLVSLLGDVFEADADVDFDMDAADLDLAEGLDAVDVGDAADAADAMSTEAADASHAAKIFSIRALIYGMFGFGAVGSGLTWLGNSGFVTTLAAAIVGGLLSGGLVTVAFNWLRATDMPHRAGDSRFVGLSGTVTLPLSDGGAGTIAVESGSRRITLRALPWDGAGKDVSAWRSVVVVEMENGVARVAPVEEDLALEP